LKHNAHIDESTMQIWQEKGPTPEDLSVASQLGWLVEMTDTGCLVQMPAMCQVDIWTWQRLAKLTRAARSMLWEVVVVAAHGRNNGGRQMRSLPRGRCGREESPVAHR
jgi:hypothetical protein